MQVRKLPYRSPFRLRLSRHSQGHLNRRRGKEDGLAQACFTRPGFVIISEPSSENQLIATLLEDEIHEMVK